MTYKPLLSLGWEFTQKAVRPRSSQSPIAVRSHLLSNKNNSLQFKSVQLSVPLVVDAGQGMNWAEAH